jgi:hypothetical protein
MIENAGFYTMRTITQFKLDITSELDILVMDLLLMIYAKTFVHFGFSTYHVLVDVCRFQLRREREERDREWKISQLRVIQDKEKERKREKDKEKENEIEREKERDKELHGRAFPKKNVKPSTADVKVKNTLKNGEFKTVVRHDNENYIANGDRSRTNRSPK